MIVPNQNLADICSFKYQTKHKLKSGGVIVPNQTLADICSFKYQTKHKLKSGGVILPNQTLADICRSESNWREGGTRVFGLKLRPPVRAD